MLLIPLMKGILLQPGLDAEEGQGSNLFAREEKHPVICQSGTIFVWKH